VLNIEYGHQGLLDVTRLRRDSSALRSLIDSVLSLVDSCHSGYKGLGRIRLAVASSLALEEMGFHAFSLTE